jgi:hypothetical protein
MIIFLSFCPVVMLAQVSNNTTSISIDRYYDLFVNHVAQRTNTIWLQSIKTRNKNRLRNGLSSQIYKKSLLLQWEQKIVFQSLWLKIMQREDIFRFQTEDIVIQWELINAINNLRKQRWLSELIYNKILTKAAYEHAYDMSVSFPRDTDNDGVSELISHTGTDGKKVQHRVERWWFEPTFVAENIAYNQTSIPQVITDRTNSPTHYDNLITDKVTQIGVAKLWPYRVMVIGLDRKSN